MKKRGYILVFLLLIITAFNYGKNYDFTNPDLKVSRLDSSVLCLQLKLLSFDYIDSLSIERENNKDYQMFVFDRGTRKIAVQYYFNAEKDKNNENIFIRIYKDGKVKELRKEIKIN